MEILRVSIRMLVLTNVALRFMVLGVAGLSDPALVRWSVAIAYLVRVYLHCLYLNFTTQVEGESKMIPVEFHTLFTVIPCELTACCITFRVIYPMTHNDTSDKEIALL